LSSFHGSNFSAFIEYSFFLALAVSEMERCFCRLDVALESVPWENIPEGVSGAGLSQSSGKPHEMESVYFGLEIKVIFLLIGERSSG
jgi:hypothetical protein